jgi:hypothetical protein
MSKELLKKLPTKHESQKVAAIQLPWRKESIKVGARTTQNEKSNEIPNIDIDIGVKDGKELRNVTSNNCIGTETDADVDLKETPSFNVQQGDNQESNKTPPQKNKVINRNSKLDRNCPKIKHDDFFMEVKKCNKSKIMNSIILYHQNVHSLTKKLMN